MYAVELNQPIEQIPIVAGLVDETLTTPLNHVSDEVQVHRTSCIEDCLADSPSFHCTPLAVEHIFDIPILLMEQRRKCSRTETVVERFAREGDSFAIDLLTIPS